MDNGGPRTFLICFPRPLSGGAKACWAQVAVSHGSVVVVVVLVLVIVLVMVLLVVVVVVRITKLTKLTTLAKLNYVTKLN